MPACMPGLACYGLAGQGVGRAGRPGFRSSKPGPRCMALALMSPLWSTLGAQAPGHREGALGPLQTLPGCQTLLYAQQPRAACRFCQLTPLSLSPSCSTSWRSLSLS